jgi:hypothetical protein
VQEDDGFAVAGFGVREVGAEQFGDVHAGLDTYRAGAVTGSRKIFQRKNDDRYDAVGERREQ